MANLLVFGKTVTARTQSAKYVLENPVLLQKFLAKFGKKSDLEKVVEAGNRAEAFNSAQGQALGTGKATTAQVQLGFAALQQEYNQIMGGVAAVHAELRRAKADAVLVAETERILRNEATLHITTAASGKGKARRSASQEALRAEIWRDADALRALTGAQALLAERAITPERLEKLRADAEALAGAVATRTATKAAGKNATQAERDAVAEQKDYWSATYRILAATAEADESLKALLKVAARAKG